MDLVKNDKDKLFLTNQRNLSKCPRWIVGLDKVISQKEVKQANNKQLLERRRRSQLDHLLHHSSTYFNLFIATLDLKSKQLLYVRSLVICCTIQRNYFFLACLTLT